MNNIEISAIVPCYNSQKHLERCLDSLINQEYNKYKIIAYDNESTDSTPEILMSYKEKYPDKLSIINVPNIYRNSYREAFEHAFENVETDYLTFIASDDYVSREYLKSISEIISPRKERIKCLQTGISIMLDNFEQATQVYKYKNIEEFKRLCMQRSPVNTPSVVYHKEIYKYLKPVAHLDNRTGLNGAEDYDMFCNLADNDVFIYPFPKSVGYYYQLHEEQCTWTVHSEKHIFDYDLMIQEYWGNRWQAQ